MIKEIIVVEGRDDVTAVKRAVDAELITTGGFGFPKGVMERIKEAQKRRGVIIFTDPDFAGEKIRKTITAEVPGCKHAFLPREEAKKDGDIGIENATPESIRAALERVRTESTENHGNPDLGCSYHVHDYDDSDRSVYWYIAIHAYSAGGGSERKPLCNLSSAWQGTSAKAA